MNLYQLLGIIDTGDFNQISDFSDFTKSFLEFVATGGMQAEIISQNEPNYHFYQYKQEGYFCITRPINMNLFVDYQLFDDSYSTFMYSLRHIRDIADESEIRNNINHFIYTCQQCIGSALDAFNNPNKARKRNGNLFEILIRSVLSEIGLNVSSGEALLPISPDDPPMKFQHDVIIKNANDELKAIGQLKTSSKDRLDKIFLDKFMYNKLSQVDTPHFAVFLNDVQRKEIKKPNMGTRYGVNSTFLPGHFTAYRIALNPLDGVYYFDLRPTMKYNDVLSPYIKAFDSLVVEDIWTFIE